jgi:hypothetical protein
VFRLPLFAYAIRRDIRQVDTCCTYYRHLCRIDSCSFSRKIIQRHTILFRCCSCRSSMNEVNLAWIILGIVAGFYTTIFLLCLSDVVYLSKEMTQMKVELADIRKISFNQTHSINHSSISTLSLLSSSPIMMTQSSANSSAIVFQKTISGRICLSYYEQRHILDYMNFLCNMAILLFGTYSIYMHGLGTQHGLAYRLIFFIFKLFAIIASIALNLHFKFGLPNDIFLYVWIDINCIASIYRSLRQAQ